MKALIAEELDLSGQILIEASAGTGKTYTISNLYIRLLLGHGCKALNVEQILLVTFTNAATAELKERILKRIGETLNAYKQNQSSDPFIQTLLAQDERPDLSIQRLIIAKQNLDLAAIFTIHGFCQRVLLEEAFESGVQFERHFLLDESEYLQQATMDYWRKHVVCASADELELIMCHWSQPEQLLKDCRALLYRDVVLPDTLHLGTQVNDLLLEYQQHIGKLKSWWLDHQLDEVLCSAKLRKNALVADPEVLKLMADFCLSDKLEFTRKKDSWGIFSEEKLQKAKTKISPDLSHLDFSQFDRLLAMQSRLHKVYRKYHLLQFCQFVKNHMARHKNQDVVVSPDDLLVDLHRALTQGEASDSLQQKLRSRFPAAMVDEFQDTDAVQYQIFSAIYSGTDSSSAPLLIMIGDPKQAIYGFRGGDIFTYINAKRATAEEQRYTLDTNWRAQSNLVSAVNHLFNESATGFVYHQDIPFHPVKAAKTGVDCYLGNVRLSAFQIRYLDNSAEGKPLSSQNALVQLAQECAQSIASNLGEGRIENRPVQSQDITVLVRDKFEAGIIKSALADAGVASVFLSKESIFASDSAYSIWLLLTAVEQYQSESAVMAALLDPMFCYSASELSELRDNTDSWADLLSVFAQARQLWRHDSVAAAINVVLDAFQVAKKLSLHHPEAERMLTDVRHLSEVLQNQSEQLRGATELVNWLGEMLQAPQSVKEQQLRLETDRELVQIVTIHGSKGLQYPIVFLPFASRYRMATDSFYHDEQQFLRYDFDGDNPALALQTERERIAEDIRLFYVAVTRAEYLCWLGCWNCLQGRSRKLSGFSETAFGHLLLGHLSPEDARQLTDARIMACLRQRFDGVDACVYTDEMSGEARYNRSSSVDELAPLHTFTKSLDSGWRLNSYSSISSKRQVVADHAGHDVDKKAYNEIHQELEESDVEEINDIRFSFTKGAHAGSYLHDVLENSDFTKPETLLLSSTKLAVKYGVDAELLPDIATWLQEALDAPLITSESVCIPPLSSIMEQQKLPEMEFYLPLQDVDIQAFNKVVSAAIPASQHDYQLQRLHGMLKGYIDLIFMQDGTYYVADYKSNYLGHHFDDYAPNMLADAMLHHDYFLQALLYSVALHRFLKSRLSHYKYQTHHGGAFYLYLRGMRRDQPGSGIFHIKFPEQAIVQLDRLLAGEQHD